MEKFAKFWPKIQALASVDWKNAANIAYRSVFAHIAGLALFFWLYHKYAAHIISARGIKLGVIGPQTAPLYATFRTNFSLWVIPAIIILAAYLIVFWKFLEYRVSLRVLFPVCILFFVLIDISVAMIDGGLVAIKEPYTRKIEYYADVPKVEGIRPFLGNYVEIFGTLSGHTRTHPPGGVLFLYIVSRILGRSLLTAAFATVLFTSVTVIPVYLLAKELYGSRVARYALGLFLITPNMVLYTAVGMDGPFSVFPILSIYLFYKALSARSVPYSVLTGIALGFAMLMNYTTVIIGVFIIIINAITFRMDREKFKNTLKASFIALGAFVLFYLIIYIWARFSLLSALLASYKKDESGMGTGYESIARYFNISIADLFAFLIGVGLPLTAAWLNEVVSEIRKIIRFKRADIYVLAGLLTLLVASFSTLFTLEVERIWIFMTPLIVIPAARYLSAAYHKWMFYAMACLLCVNILIYEIFLYTYW